LGSTSGSPGTQIDYGYTWDGANRLTQIDSSQDGLSSFDHDDSGQLTAEDHDGTSNPHTADHDYAYDDNGNRLTVTVDGGPPEDWETDPNNRLLFDGTYTYTYDAEGNRTARFIDTNDDGVITTNVDTDVTTYHWDHRNRLTAVAFDTDGDGQLDKRVEYTYDIFDQLIGKTVDDDGDGNADRAEAYVWDRGQILLDFVDDDASSGIDPVGLDDFTLARRYLHGPLVELAHCARFFSPRFTPERRISWCDANSRDKNFVASLPAPFSGTRRREGSPCSAEMTDGPPSAVLHSLNVMLAGGLIGAGALSADVADHAAVSSVGRYRRRPVRHARGLVASAGACLAAYLNTVAFLNTPAPPNTAAVLNKSAPPNTSAVPNTASPLLCQRHV
jgi:YD repeat-containing protein